jgi:uncharacterized coiled-coil DUF342 family protein
MDDFFSPPAFKPDEALIQLKRALRDLRGLSERGDQYEWKGRSVLSLEIEGETLRVKLAKRPALTPEWESRLLKNSADVRKLGDELKTRVARWREADE